MRYRMQGVLALVLVLGAAGVAHAANFCVNPETADDHASLAVGEAFTVPARNSCRPFNGFDLVAGPGTRLVTGTACRSADGNTLRVAYTVHVSDLPAPIDPLFVSMKLPYPSLAGGTAITRLGLSSVGSVEAHANWCIPPSPTIP